MARGRDHEADSAQDVTLDVLFRRTKAAMAQLQGALDELQDRYEAEQASHS